MRLRWAMLLGAVVGALALLVAACGGDDDTGGNDDGAATATIAAGDGGDGPGDGETPDPTSENGGANGSDDGGAVDACSLMTQADAEEALGAGVGAGEPEDFPPVFGCRYETGDFDTAIVSILIYDDASQAEAGYQLAIDINDYEEIDGIGERAYFALGFGITALSDRYEVSVDVIGPDDDEELEKELAQTVIGRLP